MSPHSAEPVPHTALGYLLAILCTGLGTVCLLIGELGWIYGIAFIAMAIAVVPKLEVGEWNRLSIGATALIVLTFL